MKQSSRAAQERITVQDFFSLVPEGQQADLLDGVLSLAPPDSSRANDLTGFVACLLRGYNAARQCGGRVFLQRFAFLLTKYYAVQPDLAYVRPERLHWIRATGMRGGPNIAVEVVARESRLRDYGEKKQVYQRAGVTEYWILDPLQERVEFHRLHERRYELVPLQANAIFRSQILPGFWLDVNWLLADPLPSEFDCLQEILHASASC